MLKKLGAWLFFAALIGGMVTLGLGGQYDPYLQNFGDRHWEQKYNNLVDKLGEDYAANQVRFTNLTAAVSNLGALVTGWAQTDYYLVYISATPTYVDGDTFTLPGDYTEQFGTGKVVLTDLVADGVKFNTVASSSFGGGVTTVNLNSANLTANLARVFVVALRDGLWPFGPGWITARDYGVPGQAAFQAALDAIATAERTLVLPPGTWTFSSNCTVPYNVALRPERGAVLTRSGGDHLTINGYLDCGPYQCFSDNSAGNDWVVLGAGTPYAWIEWWGGKPGDDQVDSITAIRCAVTAAYQKTVMVSGRFYISGSIPHRANLWGTNALSGFKALDTFSGTMLLDLYSAAPYNSTGGLWMKGIQFNANHVDGVACLSTSNEDIGAAPHAEDCFFMGTRGATAALRGYHAAAIGCFTGARFVSCWASDNDQVFYWPANNDDIVWEGRIDLTGTTPTWNPAIFLGGVNVHIKGYCQIGTCFNYAGAKIVAWSGAGRNQSFEDLFLETNSSNMTQFLYMAPTLSSPADLRVSFKNVYARLDEGGASPNLTALVRVHLGQNVNARYNSVSFDNVTTHNGVPGYRLVDVYVAAADTGHPGVNEYLDCAKIRFNDVEDFRWNPVFGWLAGSLTATRDTVRLVGEIGGYNYNFSYNQGKGNSYPYSILDGGYYAGEREAHGSSDTATGASPQTATFTLPVDGVWEVTVSALVGGDGSNSIARQFTTYYWSGYLADTQALTAGGKAGIADNITLSNPTSGGVVTATVSWTGGGSNYAHVAFKAKRKSNFYGYGN